MPVLGKAIDERCICLCLGKPLMNGVCACAWEKPWMNDACVCTWEKPKAVNEQCTCLRLERQVKGQLQKSCMNSIQNIRTRFSCEGGQMKTLLANSVEAAGRQFQ